MPNSSDSGLHITPLPKLGQEVGRFLIEKELPRGGQARVYRAWQTDLQRPVALKLLPASYAVDGDAVARFKREIENVARISHPNIVRVYEAGEVEGHPFFTMEFLEGQDAESMVKRGPMDPDEAASVIEAVARAVHEAHGAGIIHRDIKPGNIILRKDDTPVLTDFGLAQDLSHSEQLTQTGISMGTPAYMAPEQARGERNRVGKRTDIYAMGATLFSLLTGRRPVEGESAYELMLKVAESESPAWPRQAVEDVPADLRAIVEMAMQNDPGKRYESAADLADDLERFLHGEWVVARTRSRVAKLWVRSRRYLPVAAVVIVTLALAGGMVYTGLNPTVAENAEGSILGEPELISKPFTEKTGEEFESIFDPKRDGSWTKTGADARRGDGGELVLTRAGLEPVLISPRAPTCWGDFTLQTDFKLDGTDGPLEFLVGMPDDASVSETSYVIALGAEARDRLELRRLGVAVYSAYYSSGLPAPADGLLREGVWYRASVTRSGQRLEFSLVQAAGLLPVVSFLYEDDFPALVGGRAETGAFSRQRFGIAARSTELSLRDVTVSHRDNQHSTEALLFSVGQYEQAELRLSARLTEALPSGADVQARNERASLLFLRARCLVQLERPDDAWLDCVSAKSLVSDPDLRARLFLLSSQLETARGDDSAALDQLRVAQYNASGVASRVYHDAYARGMGLQPTEPARALVYFDWVAGNALGSPWLVCNALHAGAQLRLDQPETRAQAVAALERIESANYQRFSATFVPAVATLFRLRWESLSAEAPNTAGLAEAADWLAASVDGYGVDNSRLIEPLLRAAWMGRLASEPAQPSLLAKAGKWLEAAAQAGAEPVLIEFQRALMNQERPRGVTADQRIEQWRALAEQLTLDQPGHGVLSAVSDFFIGSPLDAADQERRNGVLRRALRRELGGQPTFWFADADADHLAEYCIALNEASSNRESAVERLEAAASRSGAGALALLRGRAARWLPIPG
ncbi:MAG: serine/threonine protein kinase [Planctomycetes bacterium]|nr:serine/threonine protein kinase [Planctomycetota bacterium]MCB9935230.1 serine/threonine protein kinase [Planctomycetota bacterium]